MTPAEREHALYVNEFAALFGEPQDWPAREAWFWRKQEARYLAHHPACPPESVIDELVEAADRVYADFHHEDQCNCLGWPEKCINGHGPHTWETSGLHLALPAIWPRIRAAVAAEMAPDVTDPSSIGGDA